MYALVSRVDTCTTVQCCAVSNPTARFVGTTIFLQPGLRLDYEQAHSELFE